MTQNSKFQDFIYTVKLIPGLYWLALLVAIVAFYGGLSDLVHRWDTQEEYGHGFFIPIISIWLIWNRKEAITQSVGKPSWAGLWLILLGILGLLLGEITAIYILMQFGFIISLFGIAIAYGGFSLARILALPFVFLLFAIPLPYFIEAQLSWRLQIVSSNLGVAVIRALGDPVFLDGNVIDLGGYKLQVVEACSGLRYLYPLLSICFLIAYMYNTRLWQRTVVFLSAIPITVFMNSLRIAMVGVLVNKWGNGMADGFLHYFEGWIIFLVCLLLLALEVVIFEKFGKKRSFWVAVDFPLVKPSVPKNQHTKDSKFNNKPLVYCIILMVVGLLSVNVLSKRQETKPSRQSLVSFPATIEGWVAKESSLPKEVESFLGLDDYLLADYSNPDYGTVNFYVAYYASQRKGVSPHSPQVCMPGGGWIISSLEQRKVKLTDGQTYEVNRTIIDKAGQKQVVYYWFEQRGRHIANEYLMKWYLLLDSIQRNRTDGALVRITTLVRPDEPIEKADKRIETFLEVSLPKLQEYVPE